MRSQYSGLVTGRIQAKARGFFPPKRRDWLWGPPSLLLNGYWRVLSPRVKPPECEADHSSILLMLKIGGAIPPLNVPS